MIIPEFAFATLGICWEYSVPGNFIEQFPPDYIRAHSTGLHLDARQAYDEEAATVPWLVYMIRALDVSREEITSALQKDYVPYTDAIVDVLFSEDDGPTFASNSGNPLLPDAGSESFAGNC